jgi:hypothetical protein
VCDKLLHETKGVIVKSDTLGVGKGFPVRCDVVVMSRKLILFRLYITCQTSVKR